MSESHPGPTTSPAVPREWLVLPRLVVRRALHGFLDRHGYDLAASLAYASFLSFVPLIASVTILISTLFGDSGAGLYGLIRALVPGASRELVTELQAFTAQARALSGWATFFFIFTSLRMFFLVEGAVNSLWGTTIKRRPLIWLGVALAVVVLGPVFMGVVTSSLLQSGASFTEFRFSGIVLGSALLTLLYKAVPGAYVRWGPAAAAGITAATGVMLLKIGFARSVAALTDLSKIYGSISAIVIFVLAIGFAWHILLLGVSFAHAIQFSHELLAHDEPEREIGRSGPLDEAVRMLLLMSRAWQGGRHTVPLTEICAEIGHGEPETRERLEKLSSANLVMHEGPDAALYRLCRPPSEISLYTIARAMGEAVPRAVPTGSDLTAQTLRQVFRRADRDVRSVLQGTSLRDLSG